MFTSPHPTEVDIPDIEPDFSAPFFAGFQVVASYILAGAMIVVLIMLIIAGTYTPLSIALLPQDKAVLLLSLVWCGAVLGVLFRLVWTHSPRWIYTPVYVALGVSCPGNPSASQP